MTPPHLRACYRHPDRGTGLSCVRCERPACPECLVPAAVGMQCRDCAAPAPGSRTVRRAPDRRASGPIVTYGLLAVNVVVFLATAIQAGSLMDNRTSQLFLDGVLWPPLVADEPWRIITAGFLHYGLIHLAVNMLTLYILGRDLESATGPGWFAGIYGVALLGGSAGPVLFGGPLDATAGASGALYGLMGAIGVLMIKLKLPIGQLLGVLAINAVITLTIPNVSLWGHLGGLVFGAAAVGPVYWQRYVRSGPVGVRRTLITASGLVALGALAVALCLIGTPTFAV